MSDPIQLTIDGLKVSVPNGTTVFDAARMNGIPIPTLCHAQNETPVGVCRVCVVDVGGRVLAASCVRPAENNMVVKTDTDQVKHSRGVLVELLMADHPSPCARQRNSGDCELEMLAKADGVGQPRFAKRLSKRGQDNSSFSIAVDHEACILCDRCIRGCDEIRQNGVLARHGKGFLTGIAFDLNMPMGTSSCVSCGECMVSCPTGALTNKSVVASELPVGDPVAVDFLKSLPYFQKVSGTFLELNKGAVKTRHYKAGEIICREGDYGSTAFYIVEGEASVYLSSPVAHIKNEGGATGFFSRLTSSLSKRTKPASDATSGRSIPIDASIDLPMSNPINTLHPGDLFGEMTCISRYPRSATVQAKTDCVMLEMLRNVLDIMQRNKTVRAKIEENYRARALEDHLRTVPMFANLSQDFIDTLRQKVELIRYNKGEVICRQNDVADAFYLVRIGFVKVAEDHPGGELVLAYLGRGSFFGEMGLLGEGRRTATVTALDHLEVVRIAAEDFEEMTRRFPEIRRELEEVARVRTEQNRKKVTTAGAAVPLESFLAQGLVEAQSLLVLDLDKCTRCDNCVRACADAHDGVTRLIREGLRFDRFLVATSCRQCRDPLCMIGCPVGSIRRQNSLEVVIEDWCIGCGLCANNCPYGNISMHPIEVMMPDLNMPSRKVAVQKLKATSCDLCRDHAEPSCVYACPHDAAHRVDPHQLMRMISPVDVKSEMPASFGSPERAGNRPQAGR